MTARVCRSAPSSTAAIALMSAVDRPEHRLLAIEDRHEGGEVGEVIAAVIGIVQEEDIALANVSLKEVAHRARRPGQRADMNRHMLGLRDEPAVEVANRG